jgi:predicted deacetylase
LPIPEQIGAFCDTWELDYEKNEIAFDISNIMQKYGIQNDVVRFCYYLKEPTKAMIQEADAAGYYEYQGTKYPRIQILNIQDIFDGKKWYCPSVVKTSRKDNGQTHLQL